MLFLVSRHTSRFLTVYGLTLPLVLVPHTELFTGPVVGAVCWGLFSIEEIAYFIEQPFDPVSVVYVCVHFESSACNACVCIVRRNVDVMVMAIYVGVLYHVRFVGMECMLGFPSCVIYVVL